MATPPDRGGDAVDAAPGNAAGRGDAGDRIGSPGDGAAGTEVRAGHEGTGEAELTVSAEDSADLAFSLVAALGGTPEQVARLRAARDGRMRATWARFAARAAGEALQRADAVRLRLALAAAALAAEDDDAADDLLASWAPLHVTATRLGLDVAAAFDDAARLAEPSAAGSMRSFGRRSDVSLEEFGWRPGGPNGPAFVRDR